MSARARWLATGLGSLVVFGLFVWLGDAVLPWDRPERIGTGAGAGAVVAGVLVAWVSSLNGSSPAPPPPAPPSPGAGPGPGAVTASGERSVAVRDNSGVIVTGDGGTVQR